MLTGVKVFFIWSTAEIIMQKRKYFSAVSKGRFHVLGLRKRCDSNGLVLTGGRAGTGVMTNRKSNSCET
jgi:hypothetical protein